MIRAVFFDWFNTLTTYYPPRESEYARACYELGFEVTTDELSRALLLADQFYSDENARNPVKKRDAKDMMAVYVSYGRIVLNAVGMPSDDEMVFKVMEKVRSVFSKPGFALYDDVLPALDLLKARGLTLGLISNIDQDIRPFCRELGLDQYLDHVVTSIDVQSEKPKPEIFLAALGQAGLSAAEAMYVGDQYSCDVIGARRVGMKPVLVDRYDLFPELSDCVRIGALTELADHL